MPPAIDSPSANVDNYARPAIYQEYDVSSSERESLSSLGLEIAKEVANERLFSWVMSGDRSKGTISSFSERESEPSIEPSKELAQEQAQIAQKHLAAFNSARSRIDELKSAAQLEDQPVNAASEKDLLAFLNTKLFARRPYITLLDNGNLRALWKNSAGEQIGLQFRGGKTVQYVFFSRRADGPPFVARCSGRDTLANIDRLIEAHDLAQLATA